MVQSDQVNKVVDIILALLQGVVDFVPRPTQISMPKEGGSITPIQAHMTNTRLGHGRPNKKLKLCDEGSYGKGSFKAQSPRPGGRKPIWQTQNVEKKRTQVKLPKLCKKACSECGYLNIFFNGINKIECRNCKYVIVKDGGDIVQDKDDYEEDQDIELFFKELDIY